MSKILNTGSYSFSFLYIRRCLFDFNIEIQFVHNIFPSSKANLTSHLLCD
jgi:hypothetical protein